MATLADIAKHIVEQFDPARTTTIERAAARAIVALDGVSESTAASEAELRAAAILQQLQAMELRELPFEFSMADPNRLVGKQRPRAAEDDRARQARQRLFLEGRYLEVLTGLGNRTFEYVSASAVRLAGATDAFVTGAGDEGGIDFYGRIPIRPASGGIAPSALTTSIIERELLFVGQSKCIGRDAEVDRGTISQFHGDVGVLLAKYEGVRRPPSNRVPEDYYRTNETCLKLFFSTGRFAPGAVNFAKAFDIVIVGGAALVQFLLYRGVGVVSTPEGQDVDAGTIELWALGGSDTVIPDSPI